MGKGRDAGSGVLAWCTRRLKIKADQTQYGILRAPWGGAILLSLPLFSYFVKNYQTPPYGIKEGLKRGELSKFEKFSHFLPLGIKVGKS